MAIQEMLPEGTDASLNLDFCLARAIWIKIKEATGLLNHAKTQPESSFKPATLGVDARKDPPGQNYPHECNQNKNGSCELRINSPGANETDPNYRVNVGERLTTL